MESSSCANFEVLDNFRRIFQVIQEYSKASEKASGLTGPQLWAVKLLAVGCPLRVSDLARQMNLRPPTVVGILDRLEAKGIVTRTHSSKDRRSVDLYLTDAGRELSEKTPEVVQNMLLKGLSEISDEQFSRVKEAMKLIVMMLGAENHIPLPLHG